MSEAIDHQRETRARTFIFPIQWAAHAEQAVAVCGPTPDATTFGRVLAAVDPVALQRALTGWVLDRRDDRRRQQANQTRPGAEARTVLGGSPGTAAADQLGLEQPDLAFDQGPPEPAAQRAAADFAMTLARGRRSGPPTT